MTAQSASRPSKALRIQGYGPLRGVLPTEVTWQMGTVADLRRLLKSRCPLASSLLDASLVFEAGCVLAEEEAVEPGAVVQFLPPVSGG